MNPESGENSAEDVLGRFKPYMVRKESLGIKFNFIIGDAVAQEWYDTPSGVRISPQDARQQPLQLDRAASFEWAEMQIIRDHIALPGTKIVECGSHQGLTAVALASWVGDTGFVSTFDAVLFNAIITRRNLEINRIVNAAAYCAAVGGTRGIVNLYNESNVIVRQDNHITTTGAVMVRLEDLIHDRVDALKLDIEGCELAVLECSAGLIQDIPRLAIEVHTDMLPEDGFYRLIKALGKRPIYLLDDKGAFGVYDGRKVETRVHLFSF